MLQPMLASLADAPLDDPAARLRTEIRRHPRDRRDRAERARAPLVAARQREDARSFRRSPRALGQVGAQAARQPLVLDGEIVALDAKGEPTGFQQLQGRIHLADALATGAALPSSRPSSPSSPRADVAFIAFDMLRDGRPTCAIGRCSSGARRSNASSARTGSPMLRISELVARRRPRAVQARARARLGRPDRQARRLALQVRQAHARLAQAEDRPRAGVRDRRLDRAAADARLLRRAAARRLRTAATSLDLRRPHRHRLQRAGARAPDEAAEAARNERVSVRERPEDQRAPALGAAGAGRADQVHRMDRGRQAAPSGLPRPARRQEADEMSGARSKLAVAFDVRRSASGGSNEVDELRTANAERRHDERSNAERRTANLVEPAPRPRRRRSATASLELPDGERLDVTNLHKIFWPKLKLTKGDLFRYYVQVAPCMLPAVADRPLVMKRFPNGVAAPAVLSASRARGAARRPRRASSASRTAAADHRRQSEDAALHDAAGRDLAGSLVLARRSIPEFADYVALDLDPSDGVPFARVLDVARWIRDELGALGAIGVPKTSGADGLHVYIPLPPGTPYEAGLLFCQIVATVVAQKHPEGRHRRTQRPRARHARLHRLPAEHSRQDAGDRLQRAGQRVRRRIDAADLERSRRRGSIAREFTIETVPARLAEVGDLWAALRKSKGVDLEAVTKVKA